MPRHRGSPGSETGWKSAPPSRRSPGREFLGKAGPRPRAGCAPGRGCAPPRCASPRAPRSRRSGVFKENEYWGGRTQSRRAAPEGSSPVITGAEQSPVPRSRKGRRPRGSAAPAPPNRIGFGEGKPAEERSRPAEEAGTWSLPAAPAISRPARLSPSLSCPGWWWGEVSAIFRGLCRAPRVRCHRQPGRGRVPAAAGAAWAAASPGTEEGWVPCLQLAGEKPAAELRGTHYRLLENRRFLGASPPCPPVPLAAGQEHSQPLHGASSPPSLPHAQMTWVVQGPRSCPLGAHRKERGHRLARVDHHPAEVPWEAGTTPWYPSITTLGAWAQKYWYHCTGQC